MLLLPTPTDGYPDETVSVALDGTTYILRWRWNGRDGAWYFSMADRDGDIVTGVRVALNVDLLAWVPQGRRPRWGIRVIDPTRSNVEPDRFALGKRVKILYLGEQ